MSKHSNKVDMRFVYTNAADSAKPGYLKAKFDKERKRLAELKSAQDAADKALSVEAAIKVRMLRS